MSSMVERLTAEALRRRGAVTRNLSHTVVSRDQPKKPVKSYYQPRRERGTDGYILKCKNGHIMDDKNTYVGRTKNNGKEYPKRVCRTCHRIEERRRRKNRQVGPGGNEPRLDGADQVSAEEALPDDDDRGPGLHA